MILEITIGYHDIIWNKMDIYQILKSKFICFLSETTKISIINILKTHPSVIKAHISVYLGLFGGPVFFLISKHQ